MPEFSKKIDRLDMNKTTCSVACEGVFQVVVALRDKSFKTQIPWQTPLGISWNISWGLRSVGLQILV